MLYKLIGLWVAAELLQAFNDAVFCSAGAIKNHKATTTGAGNFSTGGTSFFGGFVHLFHQRIGDAFGHSSFLLMAVIQYLAKAMQLAFQ